MQDQELSQDTDAISTEEVTPVVEAQEENTPLLTDGEEVPSEELGEEGKEELPASPAFTPNLKYSVGNEEKEFDPLFKDFVQSKEHEERLRELYTKADGLDHVKAKRDEYQKEYETLASEVGEVIKAAEMGDLTKVMQSVGFDTSDVGKTLQALGFDKQAILQHAYQLAQLTPEQEAIQNRERELEKQQYQLTAQQREYQQHQFTQQVQAREAELQSVLSSQEISGLATKFDQTLGKPGSFRAEVVRRAQHAAHYEGKDLSVMEAVEQVLEMAKKFVPGQAAEPKAQAKPHQAPPVIPSVPTGGSAPVKRKTNSLESMKAYAATLSDD